MKKYRRLNYSNEKLSFSDALGISHALRRGLPQRLVAACYGVSQTTISNLVNGYSYPRFHFLFWGL